MDITCVTFTNKAAIEMRHRLEKLLGRKDADNLVLGMSLEKSRPKRYWPIRSELIIDV